jgi:predicted  nucleic acid-binding Zn-ribbon protein
MSDINASKIELDSTIEKLGAEIDRLNERIVKLSGIEGQNRALTEQNSHLENEIKILKSDFIELKNIAGNISSQLDENIYTIKDILDS